nr:hypothetical protein [uncultured Capnocytophaga sp.]
MKKQLIQALWAVANGQPQQQGEKTVYPSIREQLSAIKMLMSLEDWEELPSVGSIEDEKPALQVLPCTTKDTPAEQSSDSEVVRTPQKTVNIAQQTTNTPQQVTNTSQQTTKPTISYRRTYEEWLAQKELLERLLLEEKTKKIQAKLGKMTKSKNASPASSV